MVTPKTFIPGLIVLQYNLILVVANIVCAEGMHEEGMHEEGMLWSFLPEQVEDWLWEYSLSCTIHTQHPEEMSLSGTTRNEFIHEK